MCEPMLWADEGPKSQGKIMTAILRDQDHDARSMLRGWSPADLDDMEKAANTLVRLCRQVRAMRGVPDGAHD